MRRGPWATIQWRTEGAEKLPTFRVESLRELPALIREFSSVSEPGAPNVVDQLHNR